MLVWSCKEDPAQNSDEKFKYTITSTTFTNPYDSIGIVHNLILDEFNSRQDEFYEVCDSADFVNKFLDVIAASTCEVGYYTPTSNCDTIIKNDVKVILNLQNNYTDFNDVIDGYLSSVAQTKINELIGFFDVDTNSYITMISKLETWQEEVNNSSSYNTNDKKVLLGAAAVARYSSTYWYNKEISQNNSWVYNMHCIVSGMKQGSKFLDSDDKWEEVAKADVMGFVTGYATKGTFGGALLNAVTDSAVKAIETFWGDICDTVSDMWNWF